MKVVQPVWVSTDCMCDPGSLRFKLDEYGVTELVCELHGQLWTIEKLEFNSHEEWEEWRAAQA